MRHKLSAASIAVIAQLVAAGTAQAQSWDAAANFTPASPPTNWAYVQRTGAGCVAPGIALSPTYAPVPGLQGYIAGQNTIVAKNTTNAAIAFSSVTIDGGALLMHPGTRGECAVLRFKAPGPGTYQVAIKMTAIDRASPNDVRGYIFASSAPGSAVGGAELLSAAGQFGASKSFSRSVTVTGSNPYVDFALDDGGNNDPLGPFRFDSTSISMVVTGRPDTDGGNGGGIPVLSCSKSAANPATVDVSTGKPGWTLKLPNGAASAIVQTPSMVPSPWTAVPGAQWVGPQGAPTASGNYVYETRVRVLKCPNGEPARINAQFRADNRGTLSVIDPGGTPITTMNQAGTPNYGFLPASLSPSGAPGVHSWSAPVNGIYTIRLTVANSGGPTGVAANVVLTR
jgi:hypothetical protein